MKLEKCGSAVTLEDLYNLDAEIAEAEGWLTADEWKWYKEEIDKYYEDLDWKDFR